jgi:hypothetical protein
MKFKYIILLTLIMALYFVPANAQTKKHKAKKTAAKVVHKKPAKKPVKFTKPAAKTHKPVSPSVQKVTAGSLGEAAAKITTDTSKKAGQANANMAGTLSEEIIVTTAYKPVLADAVKIRINPDLEDKTPFKAPLTYVPIDKRLGIDTGIRPLVAMKRPAEQDTDLTNNYVKIGAGNLKTTYGEAYFNNSKDPALQVGAYLKHFAQNGNLTKQSSNKEEIGVFGKSIGEVNSISGKIDFNYRGNNFYGYNFHGLPPVNLQIAPQHFSTIGAEAELAKNYKDVENDFTYAVKLKGHIFSDAYRAKESNLVLSGFLNEQINQFYAGMSASLDFSTQEDSLFNYNNSLIRVNPYLKFQGTNYKIEAGVTAVEQFGFASKFSLFPAAKLEAQVIPKFVRLFLEVKGDVNKSSLLDFSLVNPFLGQDINIKNSIDQLDIAAGLKGTLGPEIGFKITVFRNQVKDMPLFVSNFNFAKGYNRFTVIYDDGKSRVNGINAELDFKASDGLDIFGRAEVKDYQMATQAEAWNLPKYKFTGGMVLHISSNININGSLLLRGHAIDPYQVSPGVNASTNAFADISGGVEYKATKKFSVFVHVNNILNTSNQSWLYYPEYGFNAFGGLAFGF